MLRHLRIQSKLFLVLFVPVIVLGLVAALVFNSLNAVKVTGPTYNEIIQEKDLVADILPPPEFAVEAYAAVLQLVLESRQVAEGTTTDADLKHRNDATAELVSAEALFEARYRTWSQDLTSAAMTSTRIQLDEVHSTGAAFFAVVNGELLDAINAGDFKKADEIRDLKLVSLFDRHRAAVTKLVALSQTRQISLESSATDLVKNRSRIIIGTMATAVLLILLLGMVVARLISAPLKAMTKKAAEVAEFGLPNHIAALNNLGPEDEMPELETFPVDSKDEVGELATAFNAVQASAVGMAAQQVQAARNYGENLITIGRRNQSLVFRTLGLISELESNERDAGTLENLFRLDALTTRMRRQAESLLVLAGDKPMSTSSAPVEISDVIRGALSEVDDYQRVDHSDMEDISVRGRYVHSVVHLFAELIENAITYSPPTSRVAMLGRMTQYGYHIAIIDRGLGMSPEDLADVNHRLNNPVSFDLSPVRVLGHHVVSKLAERFNITVQMHDNIPNSGVTAGILLPHELLALDEANEPRRQPKAVEPVEEAPPAFEPTAPVGRRAARRNAQQAAELASADAATNADRFEVTVPPYDHAADQSLAQYQLADTTVAAELPWASAPSYEAPLAASTAADYRSDSAPTGYLLDDAVSSSPFETPHSTYQFPAAEPAQSYAPSYEPAPSYEAAPSYDTPQVFEPVPAYEPTPVPVGPQAGFDGSSSVSEFLSPWAVPAVDNRIDDLPNPADDPLYISDDEPEDDAPMTKTGFRKRIKGAQAPDTGPTDGTPAPERDAAALRSSLAGLQSGFDRAKRS
jgi:signal transduction histidine kinase